MSDMTPEEAREALTVVREGDAHVPHATAERALETLAAERIEYRAEMQSVFGDWTYPFDDSDGWEILDIAEHERDSLLDFYGEDVPTRIVARRVSPSWEVVDDE